MEDGRPPAGPLPRTPFDRSLELRELRDAALAYAAHHGEPGSPAFRSAWLRFRQHIRSIEDLQRVRDATRRKPASGPGHPSAPRERPASPVR